MHRKAPSAGRWRGSHRGSLHRLDSRVLNFRSGPATVTTLLFAALAAFLPADPVLAAELSVYSARKENLIRPLLDRFSEQTGIRVRLVSAKADALLARMRREGDLSPADVFIASDVARLHRAKVAGVFQPMAQAVVEAVPENYRDPGLHWTGVSRHVRAIVYAPDRVDAAKVARYRDLANVELRGRVCMRSSESVYNQSLMAELITRDSSESAVNWARGVVANLARRPSGGDRSQISAIAAGICDVSLANSYYFLGMKVSKLKAEQEAVGQVELQWPDQQGDGAHTNVTGIGIVRTAPNPQAATRLVEFLLSLEAQIWFAENNYEFPIRPDVPAADELSALGPFRASAIPLVRLGEKNAEAVRLFDQAGWR